MMAYYRPTVFPQGGLLPFWIREEEAFLLLLLRLLLSVPFLLQKKAITAGRIMGSDGAAKRGRDWGGCSASSRKDEGGEKNWPSLGGGTGVRQKLGSGWVYYKCF